MAEFARYYVAFLMQFFQDVGFFFRDLFLAFANIFTTNIPRAFNKFIDAAVDFNWAGWLLFVITFIVGLVFWFFVIFRLVQIIRRYIIFRAKEVEKDQLLEEIAKANDKIAKLTIEKNRIYAMKLNANYNGLEQGGQEITATEVKNEGAQGEGPALPAGPSRFARLSAIDRQFEFAEPFVSTAETDGVTLSQLVDSFVNFAASQQKLYYKKDVIRYFFAGMATTKVLILEGISGTGKTSLPYAMGRFFEHPTSIVSIQPSWRDRGDLIGYLNEFTKTFNETDFLVALYEATYRDDPSFIVLDEMNLARIEYYFAEFLSVMEMPDKDEWLIDVVPVPNESDPKHIVEGKVLVPQSLWFVGTANQDDSTFTITDKVYDRTITIDLNTRADYFDAPITPPMKISYDYLEYLFTKARKEIEVSDKAKDALAKVDNFMFDNFKVTFGNRILRQIYAFIPVFVACGGTETEAIDFLLMSKILRKLNGVNLVFLKKELNGLISLLDSLFGKNQLPQCVEYIKQLIRKA